MSENATAWEDLIKRCDDPEVVSTLKELRKLSVPPSDPDAYNTWLEADDGMKFLTENSKRDWVVTYSASVSPHTLLLHGVLVPKIAVSPPDIDDLLRWQYNPCQSWRWVSDESKTWIEPPLADSRSKTLGMGEQLVFIRWDVEGNSYIEISQKFAHVADVRYVAERHSWCEKGQRGDIEPIVYMFKDSAGCAILFRRDILSAYAALTDSVLVRMFDFVRRDNRFIGWGSTTPVERKNIEEKMIYYKHHIIPGYASFSKGIQIATIAAPQRNIYNILCGRAGKSDEKYESFIALDWKNKRIAEISCAPNATTNYFTKSDLPFELSPAFFRAEVLSKYKADRDKYEVTEYSISCPNVLSISYSINDAGQVCAYLCDLRGLPYDEQLYWKSFNEQPKPQVYNFEQKPRQLLRRVLSNNVYMAHFAGSWDLDVEPLQGLAETLRNLKCPWWQMPASGDFGLNYPSTKSKDDWSREIIALHQLLVENLVSKVLRSKVEELGYQLKGNERTLKLLEKCLIASDVSESDARSTLKPLHELKELRNKFSHPEGSEAKALMKEAISKHGNLLNHYKCIVGECNKVFQTLGEKLK